jgi:hypothetical protein
VKIYCHDILGLPSNNSIPYRIIFKIKFLDIVVLYPFIDDENNRNRYKVFVSARLEVRLGEALDIDKWIV